MIATSLHYVLLLAMTEVYFLTTISQLTIIPTKNPINILTNIFGRTLHLVTTGAFTKEILTSPPTYCHPLLSKVPATASAKILACVALWWYDVISTMPVPAITLASMSLFHFLRRCRSSISSLRWRSSCARVYKLDPGTRTRY